MERERLFFGISLACGLAAAGGGLPAAAQAGTDKPMTIYVAGTAGGGIDLYARAVGRHLGRHIPGNPTVTVQLMPGAGGMRGKALAETRADRPGALLRGHGNVVVGPIVRRVIARAIYTDINARLLWQAITLGGHSSSDSISRGLAIDSTVDGRLRHVSHVCIPSSGVADGRVSYFSSGRQNG